MRQRTPNSRHGLAGPVGWGVTSLLLLGCNDYLTGQIPEPEGPVRVTRLTLFDTARKDPVFTDTSIPDCSKPENAQTPSCKSDPFKDDFTPAKSPPTTDSGMEIRIVFNKIPLQLDGKPTETRTVDAATGKVTLTTDDRAASLKCEGCTGSPPTRKTLILSGSDTSSNPTEPGHYPAAIPYGPALLLEIDPADPKASLEPQTTYTAEPNMGLADRNGNRIQVDAAALSLLRFTVSEPFQVLRFGTGDGKDAWEVGKTSFTVTSLPLNGVLAVYLNAPIDEAALTATTVTAKNNGMDVKAKVFFQKASLKGGMKVCGIDRQRTLFIAPETGAWGSKDGKLTLTIKGSEVRDVSQAPGHPAMMGKHTLAKDIQIEVAKLADKAQRTDATKYAGLVYDPTVPMAAACPGPIDLF
jgi:hypothetical protein